MGVGFFTAAKGVEAKTNFACEEIEFYALKAPVFQVDGAGRVDLRLLQSKILVDNEHAFHMARFLSGIRVSAAGAKLHGNWAWRTSH
jgi:hypothetical protein